MGIPDDLVTSYRAKHPEVFPEGEDLVAIEAKAQSTQKSKKRQSPQAQTGPAKKKTRR